MATARQSLISCLCFFLSVTLSVQDSIPVNDCSAAGVALNTTSGTLRIDPSVKSGANCTWNITGFGPLPSKDALAIVVDRTVTLSGDDKLVINPGKNDSIVVTGKTLASTFGVILVEVTTEPVVLVLQVNESMASRLLDLPFTTSKSPLVVDPSTFPQASWQVPINNIISKKESNGLTIDAFNIQVKAGSSINRKVVVSPIVSGGLDMKNVDVSGSSVAKEAFDLLADKPGTGVNLTLKSFDFKTSRLSFRVDIVDSFCSDYKTQVEADLEVIGENLNVGQSVNCLFLVNVNSPLRFDYSQLGHHLFGPKDELTISSGGRRLSGNSTVVARFNAENVNFIEQDILSSYSKTGQVTISYWAPFIQDITQAVKIKVKQAKDAKVDETSDITVKSDGDNLFIYQATSGQATFIPKDDKQVTDGDLRLYSDLDVNGMPFAVIPKMSTLPKVIASPTRILRLSMDNGPKGVSGKFGTSTDGTISTVVGNSDSLIWTNVSSDANYWYIPQKEMVNASVKGVLDLSIQRMVLEGDGSYLKLWSPGSPEVLFQETYNKDSFTTNHVTQLPLLRLNPTLSYVLEYKGFPTNPTKVFVAASVTYSTNKQCNSLVNVSSSVNQTLIPTNYPNLLPLWDKTIPTTPADSCGTLITAATRLVHVVFRDIDLKGSQKVMLNSAPNRAINFDATGKTPLNDAIFESAAKLTVSSYVDSKSPLLSQSGRGYMMSVSSLPCGGEVTVDKTSNITSNASHCLWIVKAKDDKVGQVVNFTYTLTGSGDKGNVITTFYDNLNTRESKVVDVSNTSWSVFTSSLPGFIIDYSVKDVKKPAPILSVNFTVTSCSEIWKGFNSSAQFCGDGKRCLLPSWKCNGINDCGDNFDERMCNTTIPIPNPSPKCGSAGVGGWVIVLLIIPMSIAVGVLLTLFGPMLLSKFRGSRYSEFRNFAEDT